MDKLKRLLGTAACLVGISGFSGMSSATEIAMFGHACVPTSAPATMTYTDFGAFNGEVAGTDNWSCPLVVIDSDDGGLITDMVAVVLDRSTSANVSCTMRACNEAVSQGTCDVTPVHSTSGSAGLAQLFFEDIDSDVHGIATLRCSVPGGAGSGVVSYRANK